MVEDPESLKGTSDPAEHLRQSGELTVKNNKVTDVEIILKDQYPLSNVKEVETELTEAGGAVVNAEIGVLTRKMNLKPGESKKFRFTYTVKYPKDKKIANLR